MWTRSVLAASLALSLAALPVAAAGPGPQPADPVLVAPVPAPAPAPRGVVFTVRGGVGAVPAYFGADHYVAVPDFALSFESLRFGNGHMLGSDVPADERYGFGPRGSLRLVRERSAGAYPELAGLNDIDFAVELGGGIGFRARNFEAAAVVRYGVLGHESWVGELSADLVARPTDRLKLTLGPRLFFADDTYAATYFGVTPAEAVASGLPAFAAQGGALSAGIELGARYALANDWAVEGAVRYDRLQNDAAASPITGLGSADQFQVRIGLSKRFRLEF